MTCGACGTENTIGAKFCSECGATLAAHGRGDAIAPLLAAAREVFERLRAQPRLELIDALEATISTAAPTSA